MTRIRLNRAGMAAMLNSNGVGEATREHAEQIAAKARQAPTVVRHDAPVEVEEYKAHGGRLVTPRTAYAVTINHYGGAAMEAKYGVLQSAVRTS